MLSDLGFPLGVEGPAFFQGSCSSLLQVCGVLLATLSPVPVVVYLSHWVGLLVTNEVITC